MSIIFNSLGDTVRVGFTYTEFDGTGGSDDASLNPFTCLLLGQKLEDGTAEPYTLTRPMSEKQANELFGRGSMLARMVGKYITANPMTKMYAMPLPDDEAGQKAQAVVHLEGQVTQASPVCLYIGGQLVRVAARFKDSAADIATALRDAVNNNPDLPVMAKTEDGALIVESRHAGEVGNDIDVRLNYKGEVAPQGIRFTITPMQGGAGNPLFDDVIAAMGNTRFHFIACPYRDRYSLDLLMDEMDSRWEPLRQIDGQVVVVNPGTFGECVDFAGTYNAKHLTVIPAEGSPTPSYEDAAASMGILAYYGNSDPARPFTTLQVPGVEPGVLEDRFSDFPEKNQGLFEGLSTRFVDPSGRVCLGNIITTYRLNPLGAEDKAFLSVNSPLTLSYIRYDWNNFLKLKFPRHKLASDSEAHRYNRTTPIIYPKLGKSVAIARASVWADMALVENIDAFKRSIMCERNARNENRLDWFMQPDLVNQFLVAGTLIRHIV